MYIYIYCILLNKKKIDDDAADAGAQVASHVRYLRGNKTETRGTRKPTAG